MENINCCLSGITASISCGECRGVNEVWRLLDCTEDTTSHLASCGLSNLHLTESQLILTRAGLFDIPVEQQQSMYICASHRFKLGRYWRALRSCQYPTHQGRVRRCQGRSVFNIQTAKEVKLLYGTTVSIGSRKLSVLSKSWVVELVNRANHKIWRLHEGRPRIIIVGISNVWHVDTVKPPVKPRTKMNRMRVQTSYFHKSH